MYSGLVGQVVIGGWIFGLCMWISGEGLPLVGWFGKKQAAS